MPNEDVMKTFQKKLGTMFRKEDSSFNWGVYRIINQRNQDVDEFIDKEIPHILKENLSELSVESLEEIEKEIQKVKQSIQDAGLNYEESPKYKDLLEQKNKLAKVDSYEILIYNYLLEFFSRYYRDGDFISRFYFKNDSYVVPYDGSEVYMHWATKDQYYVKTADEYKRLSLTVGDTSIVLRVVKTESEKNNNKSKSKKFFILDEEKPFEKDEDSNELFINLNLVDENDEIKSLGGKADKKQIKLNNQICEETIEYLNEHGISFDKNTVFETTLKKFQRRYTEDFFIHKNLKVFLQNELEYYMQSEVLKVDSLIDYSGNINKDLVVITKSFRKIALKIIERLAAIEELKKKVWEKKKFVLETNYVITLDKIAEYAGEEYLESISDLIISNKNQIDEWKNNFDIEIKNKENLLVNSDQQSNVENKKEWKKLPLDTKHFVFEKDFNLKLLNAISLNYNVDEILDGLMLKSENWQALNLMQDKYASSAKCIYIDPPYNTEMDRKQGKFLYKDGFTHSSWIGSLSDRLTLAKEMLNEDGLLFSSIDDEEVANLKILLDNVFTPKNFVTYLIWNTEGHTDNQYHIKVNHEYIATYLKSSDDRDKAIGYVIDPNTREESNLWKGFAENSITKNGPKNPYSEVLLPVGFPCKVRNINLEKTTVSDDFFEDISDLGYITRDITKKYDVTYPIKLDSMEVREGGLSKPCRVLSGWANLNKLYKFIDNNCVPIIENDAKMEFYLSENGVIYYRKERDKARNIVSVLRNMGTTEQMRSTLENMGLSFTYPKPVQLLEYLLKIGNVENKFVIDFFAGSGTTAHAVLNLNKTGGKAKYILIEMGDYFYDVTKPRIQKLLYSNNWKNGKPQEMDGIGGFFKYQTLEQYEDALENVEFKQTDISSFIQDRDVLFRYNFDHGTAESKTFLGADVENNMNFEIVTLDKNMEKVPTSVDLIESFNYIIGLWVDKYIVKEDDGRKYIALKGKIDDETVFVVWRDPSDIDNIRDRKFIDREIIVGEEYSRLYVNSDYSPEEQNMQKYYNIFDEWQKRLW